MNNKLSDKARRVLAVARNTRDWVPYAKDNREILAAVTELANAGLIITNKYCQMRVHEPNVVTLTGSKEVCGG